VQRSVRLLRVFLSLCCPDIERLALAVRHKQVAGQGLTTRETTLQKDRTNNIKDRRGRLTKITSSISGVRKLTVLTEVVLVIGKVLLLIGSKANRHLLSGGSLGAGVPCGQKGMYRITASQYRRKNMIWEGLAPASQPFLPGGGNVHPSISSSSFTPIARIASEKPL